jgi:hypothetical protein
MFEYIAAQVLIRMSRRNATEKLGAQGLRAVLRNIGVNHDLERLSGVCTFVLNLSTELHPVGELSVW